MSDTSGSDDNSPNTGDVSGLEIVGNLPDGCISNFAMENLEYVAGNPDRLLFGRYFQPVLIYDGLNVIDASGHAFQPDAKARRSPGAKSSKEAAKKQDTKSAKAAAALHERADQLRSYQKIIGAAFPHDDPRLASMAQTVSRMVSAGVVGGAGTAPRRLPAKPGAGKQPPLVVSPLPIQELIGKVGILFYDRLRFRNIGTTIGEHVTTLALAPGEEITFTQRSETLKRTTIEEELTRENEQEFRLSSTWSTDWGAESAFSSTFNVGGDLGLSGNVQVPKVDFINVGGQVGGNIAYSETRSRNVQLNYSVQLVQDIGRRIREAHTTTVSVSTERTESFQTNRRVINENPLRALMLRFFKIYNKERVTLERYNAKLALNICLVNPLLELFQALDEQLDRVDPNNAANYSCVPPAEPASEYRYITLDFEDPADFVAYMGYYQIGFVSANPPNADLVYSRSDTPELIGWDVKLGDTNEVYAADLAQYGNNGGSFIWGVTGPPEANIAATRDFWVKAWSDKSFLGGAGVAGAWWTKKLKFRIRMHFATDPADNLEYQQCLEAERIRLLQELSADRLDSLVLAALQPIQSHLFRKVIEQTFLPEFAAYGDHLDDFLIKEFRHYFDWNEAIIQNMPSWVTGQEDALYQHIRDRLSDILPGYDPGRVLPRHLFASGVQVVLPIRPGAEKEVLDMLVEHKLSTEKFLTQFAEFRDGHYGEIPRDLPDFADVLAPACEFATPDCSQAWDHDWEKPRSRFDVLGAWSDYSPTDGLHLEPRLSVCAGGDEAQLLDIEAQAKYRLAASEMAARTRYGLAAPSGAPDDGGNGEP